MKSRTATVKLVLLLVLSVTAQTGKYLEVSEFYAKVYVMPSASSQFIGLAQKGERYTIAGNSGPWLQIYFKGTYGWVYQGNVKLFDGRTPLQSPSLAQPRQVTPDPPPVPHDTQQPPVVSTQPETLQAQGATATPDETDQRAPVQPTHRYTPPVTPAVSQPAQPRRRLFRREQNEPERKRSPWFTQHTFSHLPPSAPGEESAAPKQKYFQVTTTPARILVELSPESPLLGLVRKGDLLVLLGEGDSWCKVAYGDSSGWIEHRQGRVVTAPSSVVFDDFKMFLLILGGTGAIVLLLALVAVLRHLKSRTPKDVSVRRSVLIIAKTTKLVQYTLTDTSTSLERCFTEIGFNINVAKDLTLARNSIDHNLPDVVLVDWQFERNILAHIEQLFSQRPTTTNVLFIFYNVPDPAGVPPSDVLPNVNYLGLTFSDRDIFKLVTPLIITAERTKTIQKSVQSAALEGEIAEGNLLEVLQFIEIGSKSGCMMVETERPFGIVYFDHGRIVYAAAKNMSGRDAVFEILNLPSGKFRFVLNKRPSSSNVNSSTLEVLMEWTKSLDETSKR